MGRLGPFAERLTPVRPSLPVLRIKESGREVRSSGFEVRNRLESVEGTRANHRFGG